MFYNYNTLFIIVRSLALIIQGTKTDSIFKPALDDDDDVWRLGNTRM